MKEKAKAITQVADTDLKKAKRLELWLQTELGYTLEMTAPGDNEPLDFFLFENQKGHCEYFASTMAVMARTAGIPSRNVNGFLGGKWNGFDDYISVTASDAHSWVELFIEGHGWMTFDPTPAAGRSPAAKNELSILNKMKMWSDSIKFAWFRWVIAYDLYKQLRFLKNLQERFKRKRSGGGTSKASSDSKNTIFPKKTAFLVGLGVFALIALVTLSQFIRKRKMPSKPHLEASRHYQKVLTALEKKGFPKYPTQTPSEHLKDVSKNKAMPAREYDHFLYAYYRARYAQDNLANAKAQTRAKALIKALKQVPHKPTDRTNYAP